MGKTHYHICILTVVMLLVCKISMAQRILTLENALDAALSKNYGIKIAGKQLAKADYAYNIGNAGMLPTITLEGGVNFSNNNIKQRFQNGLEIETSGVRSDQYNSTVLLNWTIFDGLKMFATYSKLKFQKYNSMLAQKIEMQNTIATIMQQYYKLVSLSAQMRALEKNIKIGENRVKIAEGKAKFGASNNQPVLQAKVDINNLKINLLELQSLYSEAMVDLNRLMGDNPGNIFSVKDTIAIGYNTKMADAQTLAKENNLALEQSRKSILIAKYVYREIQGERFPQIDFITSYNFSQNESQAGFSLFNRNLGFNVGFGVSFNIFDSWRVNTQSRLAKIDRQIAKLELKQQELAVSSEVIANIKKLEQALDMVALAKTNLSLAEENVNLALARFKGGVSASTELQLAQQSYGESALLFHQSAYQAKLIEIELLELTGLLLNNPESNN